MEEPQEPLHWPGHLVGLGLFLFIGLPMSFLFLMGERDCDLHIGPPCSISWGASKLIEFVVMMGVCAIASWVTNKFVNFLRGAARDDPV